MESHLDGFSGALHVVSPADASYLRDEFGHVPTWSIPVAIPVDIEQRALSTTTTSEARDSCLRIVVYGDFRQPQMRHALGLLCKEVLYQVRDRSFKVILLGRVPADAEIEGWVSGLDFEILAWAEDYVGVLQSADIVILPDRFGTGLKNRAVQSLALGLCVLGTPVAFEGMPLLDMTHAAIASTSQEQLERLRLLLDNDRLRRQLGADGQKLTQSNYGSSNVAAAWNSAYRTLLSNDNKQIS
ncbi:glycosyltransferase involved in cell wall biosynthesis [Cryobacterium sp. MP_3.1]|uniref:glycosyltransferase n=1 Tax=Cryobacterium sp. MP_3.1 TaxID=3071711 RepID=UPI002E052EC9|nr:glycosyltransferase involved in cell wall biosynthesis [Cryobacterium sp. MP_3.1]